MKFYVYSFVEGLDRLNKPPRGVSGAPVRLVKIEDLGVLVSVTRGIGHAVTRKDALAHHEVVRSVFKQTTQLLPFQFGQLLTEQQLRNFVFTHRQAIKAQLAHVRGCAEMNVRMSGPRINLPATPLIKTAKPAGPGTRFLLEKRREFRGDEWRASEIAELSHWFSEKLGNLTRDAKFNIAPAERAILARVDHLVERANIPEYRAKMARGIEDWPEMHFMVSGPWPPYSFANIELEFKWQFGVS